MINDFIEYWAAARLLVSAGNPYSPAQLLSTEQAVGWSSSEPLMMWNPPWTLSLIWPLGFLDYDAAQFVWFMLHTLIVLLGARSLWEIFTGDPIKSRYAWLSALTFGPVYFVLLLGQIGPLILLGLIGFLYFSRKEAWLLAGASITLLGVKPHVLYLLGLAWFFWLWQKKCWRGATGTLLVSATIAIFPLLWSPTIYFQYAESLRTTDAVRPLDWATPSLGTVLDALLTSRSMWMRVLPTAAGAIWFLWYWRRNAKTWNWVHDTPLLVAVSLATAPFVWTFDFVVLLPAVIQGAAWVAASESSSRRKWIIGLHLLLNGTLLPAKLFLRNDFWYFWLAPMYLVIYLYVRSRGDVTASER